jgi:hypothetical protein
MSVKSQQTKFSLDVLANWDKQSHEKLAMHKRTIANVSETAVTARKGKQADLSILHQPTTTVISTSH